MYISPQRRKRARVILILGVLICTLYLSHPSTGSSQSLAFDPCRTFYYSRRSLHILKATHWDTFYPERCCAEGRRESSWLDLVGFRRGEAFALASIWKWQQRCWRVNYWPGHKRAPFEEKDWVNVTGVLSGEWARYREDADVKEKSSGHLNAISTRLNWPFRDPEGLAMNVTGNEGGVMLRIDENVGLEMEVEAELEEDVDVGLVQTRHIDHHAALIRSVAATLTVYDGNSSDSGWEMRVHGVHWPQAGTLLLTTTSKKFAGIFGLPHLSTTKDYFVASQRLLSASVEKTFTVASWFKVGNPWAARPDAEPHCEYVDYVQVYPQRSVLPAGHEQEQPNALSVSERVSKMHCPHGVGAILEKPKLQMFRVIFSPDCGFILEPKAAPVSSSQDRQHLICKY